MAMVCDACGTKYSRESGESRLHVTPPSIDFRTIEAFVNAGLPAPDRISFVQHDLCLQCTSKALAHLGLPTNVCEVPTLPTPPAPEGGNTGALTDEDLRSLGLDPSTP
jgi:hypothetical protein